ncbi:hypothetical protein EIN_064850 [Entamoeba invadens IP1]|uniref:TLDc domain-containing protein n=1 Tax=Entamoeba invadens IP1 TaxID=370355 RepID=A0A0A1TXK1_ENTIV|nr:hypothetical protein EIN_064850 [Entamoeba invadens IP1]ELP84250.1 hypothetical protein EIN_064850 [Entamoeba invadens IP1]|eukprot:XP_004183596.1 hypothetical protein EIN_064850 [Entamoeba invadens IP1]
MEVLGEYTSLIENWTRLRVKEILYDSYKEDMTPKEIDEKIVFHRQVILLVQTETHLFGSFIGTVIPHPEETRSTAIESDSKHFIFSLQNKLNRPMRFEPGFNEEFTSLFVYGLFNKRNVVSCPNAFFINVGTNSYVTKKCFDYYLDPENVGAEIFADTVLPKRFAVKRLLFIQMTDEE